MLRRVGQLLRVSLFVLGCLAVILLVPSFLYQFAIYSPAPGAATNVSVRHGYLRGSYMRENDTFRGFYWHFDLSRHEEQYRSTRLTVWPTVGNYPLGSDSGGSLAIYHLTIPLWLLAFVCLAWPVTSFLLTRRRRGRGFPVEMLTHE